MVDVGSVAGCLRQKTILITGSTGFLGKLVVEKILRVQPEVKKLYLLVRALDDASAQKRVLDEVIGKDVFNVLGDMYGTSFDNMIKEKVVTLAGDMTSDNLGLNTSQLDELSKDIDVIVNSAATTNFFERYDVALASNTLGAKNMCLFAKRCHNLEMLLHVSTAFVTGAQEGVVMEKPFEMGETPKLGKNSLDIDAELELVEKVRSELKAALSDDGCSPELERKTMRELGLKRATHFGWQNVYTFTKAMGEMLLGKHGGDTPLVVIRPSIITSTFQDPFPGWTEDARTIDATIVAYEEQALPCFIGDRNIIIDAVPGDMVVSAIMVAIASAAQRCTRAAAHVIYNVSSGSQNPLHFHVLEDTTYNYFTAFPRTRENGRSVCNKRVVMFTHFMYFQAYMTLMYRLPIEILHVVSILFFGMFKTQYEKFNQDYNILMLTAKLYAPFCFSKARFDDTNLTELRMEMGHGVSDEHQFNFDPKIIDWSKYLFTTHIPCVLKYSHQRKSRKAKKLQ